MHVDAILCDSAKVREGLLHLLGGGITRLWRDEFPAAMGVDLALLFTISTAERQQPHPLRVQVLGMDGELIAEVEGMLDVSTQEPTHLDPWEEAQFPFSLPLQSAVVPRAGDYRIEILVDGQSARSLSFKVAPRPEPDTP